MPAANTALKVLELKDGPPKDTASSKEILEWYCSSCINKEILHQAAQFLTDKQVVAFPTETVYGLGANALDQEAVEKIYQAKGRPSDNPLIVHVSSLRMLVALLRGVPLSSIDESRLSSLLSETVPSLYIPVIEKHWPGPLTLLFPKPPHIPPTVTANQPTIAVRFPSHPVARALIELCGFPLAAPSANLSSRPSPTLASHVYSDLNGRIPMIIDGGACSSGVESSVVDGLRSPPAILRPGGVTVEMLKELPGFQNVLVYRKDFVDKALEEAPTTPGMKYRHYTPNAQVILFHPSSSTHSMDQAIMTQVHTILKDHPNACIGIMRTHTPSPFIIDSIPLHDYYLGSPKNPQDVAHHLFHGLRTLESQGVDMILVEGIHEEKEGDAVMNRLTKAASRVIFV